MQIPHYRKLFIQLNSNPFVAFWDFLMSESVSGVLGSYDWGLFRHKSYFRTARWRVEVAAPSLRHTPTVAAQVGPNRLCDAKPHRFKTQCAVVRFVYETNLKNASFHLEVCTVYRTSFVMEDNVVLQWCRKSKDRRWLNINLFTVQNKGVVGLV